MWEFNILRKLPSVSSQRYLLLYRQTIIKPPPLLWGEFPSIICGILTTSSHTTSFPSYVSFLPGPHRSCLAPLCFLNYDVHSPVDSSPSPVALPHPPLLHLMNISQASRDSPPPLSSYSQTPSVLSVPITFRDDSIIVLGKVHLRRPEGSGEHIIWRKSGSVYSLKLYTPQSAASI